jgi:hypothetical protein
MLLAVLGKGAELPRCRTGTAGCVEQPVRHLLPGQLLALIDHRLGPVLPIPISAGIDELLELPVRDLKAIDPVGFESHATEFGPLDGAARHPHHACWPRAGRIEGEPARKRCQRSYAHRSALEILEPFLADPPSH